MDNLSQSQVMNNTINGTIMGFPTVISYSYVPGESPESINLNCTTIEETSRMSIDLSCSRDEVWNITAKMTGHKPLMEILYLIQALEEEVLTTLTLTKV